MAINLKKFKPKNGYVLCLKSVKSNMEAAHNGFIWPKSGICKAPDWKPTKECGNGLHAFIWGSGDADLRCSDLDANWLVLSVLESEVIDLEGKVKFPECEVVFCGDRETAVSIIHEFAPSNFAVMFCTATAGDSGTATAGYRGTATAGYSGTATAWYRGTATAGYSGTATAGDRGTATAGDRGTATAGDRGTATAGDRGTATAGNRGTATAGDRGTATAGYRGTATAGDSGTATAGDSGTATAGYSGTATAGYRGTATAGYRGTATAGNSGTATAGDRGTATAGDSGTATAGDSGTATAGLYGFIAIEYYDKQKELYLKKMAFVDNVSILAGVKYHLNENAELEAVNDTEV